MVADYYEKKKREIELVLLSDGAVLEHKDYKKMIKEWDDIAMPPSIVGRPRKSFVEEITRYRLIENQVIEEVQTDFEMLPIIFVDGNSVMIKTPKNGNVRQMTRPYVYHAKGAQRLKNYAGISWANEIENTVQHKFMVAKEALPKEEEFMQAYKDVQKANVLVFNSVYEEDPDKPIGNPVREIQRVPMPPEIASAFTGTDQLIQNVLGTYDAALGINNNQLSGIAIVEAATQNNATAMPFIVGFLQGYQRAAQCYVNLMPKYYTTPRTLPLIDEEGKKGYIKINQDEGVDMDFDASEFNVLLKAGASFQVQKSRTIGMLKEAASMSPLFGQFMAEKGIGFILDNMEGRGIEQLKEMVGEWVKEMQQQKQLAMQSQMQQAQNNPAVMKNQIEMKKVQMDAVKSEKQFQIDMKQLELDEKKILADLAMTDSQDEVQRLKAQTERFAKQTEVQLKKMDMRHNHFHDNLDKHLKHKDMQHKHAKETIELHHMINQPVENDGARV
jgi:hypothetical protein